MVLSSKCWLCKKLGSLHNILYEIFRENGGFLRRGSSPCRAYNEQKAAAFTLG